MITETFKDKFFKTVRHFFPDLTRWLDGIADPRQEKKTTYSLSEILWTGLMMFICKLGARRQIDFEFRTAAFLSNLQKLTGKPANRVCSSDAVGYLCKQLPTEELAKIPPKLVNRLIRMKALSRWRLLDNHYLIAVDGTRIVSFEQPHCEHCLTAEINGKMRYYHHVLVAQLVTAHGLALTVGYEFIDNRSSPPLASFKNPEEWKQDCELKAFYRLAPRLKQYFPQLSLCLLVDSLYVGKGFFQVCEDCRWKYIAVFKEGSMPAVYREYEALKELSMPTPAFWKHGEAGQRYHWVNEIGYHPYRLNVLECLETSKAGEKKFVWMTNIPVTRKNFSKLANQGGRQRWKIENQGFNIQKNGGYGLEHSYSFDPNGMVNFFVLLQIAHILNQLLEKGSLVGKDVVDGIGGLFKVARRLLESLRNEPTSEEEFQVLLLPSFQIRLDTS